MGRLQLLWICVGLLTLTGCNEVYKGQVQLLRPIAFVNGLTDRELSQLQNCDEKNKTGRSCTRLREKYEKNRKVLEAITYGAKVIPGKNNIKMEILNEKGRVEQEFSIDIPKKAKLPKYEGEFLINSQDSGFTYDIAGELNTTITYSDRIRGSESCTWSETYEVCDVVWVDIPGCVARDERHDSRRDHNRGRNDRTRDDRGRNDRGRNHRPRNPYECQRRERICRLETRVHYGRQEVEYYFKYTQKDLAFDMISTLDQGTVGEYTGQYNDRDKIYTYKGVCY